MRVFLNCSNHPSRLWAEEQRQAAQAYGRIIDIRFPNVSPYDDISAIGQQAQTLVETITHDYPDRDNTVIMIQGEMTLVYQVLKLLESLHYKTVAATTERNIITNSDGSEIHSFSFVSFREYY